MPALAKAQFVDRLAPQAEWRLVHRLADAATPSITRALGRALVLPEDETTWARVIEQLQYGNSDRAVEMVDMNALAEALQDKVWPLIRAIYMQSARITVRRVPVRSFIVKEAARNPRQASRAKLMMAFDETNPYATEWAQRKAARFVTEITGETRKALRALTSDAFRNGVPPRTLARQMRQVVGLTERQAIALNRQRQRMHDEGVVSEVIERRMEFQASRALRDRTLMIARTETIAASNGGQVDAWQQARSDGLIETHLVKEWIVTPDDRLCPECEPLDGEQVAINAAFPGGVREPPLHPNCRCAVGLVEP